MNSEYILKCEEDTKNMAKDIAPFIKNNIIFLNGEIGAGKTTFTKYLVETYGLADLLLPLKIDMKQKVVLSFILTYTE